MSGDLIIQGLRGWIREQPSVPQETREELERRLHDIELEFHRMEQKIRDLEYRMKLMRS